MRLIVLGSLVPQTARTLWRLLAAGHEVEELWLPKVDRAPWRRRDRSLRWLAPTWSVGAAIRNFNLHVRRVGPLRRDSATADQGCRPGVDAILGCCFPYIVPESMLAYYAGRACNLHPALLPRYRGPLPMASMLVDEALEASGMTLHLMSARFDEGDVIAQEPVAWPNDGWFRTWEADLADAGARLAVDALPAFLSDDLSAKPQTGAGNYAKSLAPGSLTIDAMIDERRARWLAGSLGRVMPLTVANEPSPIAAGPIISGRQRSSLESPRVAWRSVECDVADARLRFRRWDGWHRRAERMHELAGLMRRPLKLAS